MDIESNTVILKQNHENPNAEPIDFFDSNNDISEPNHDNPNAKVIDLETEQKFKDIYVAIYVAK